MKRKPQARSCCSTCLFDQGPGCQRPGREALTGRAVIYRVQGAVARCSRPAQTAALIRSVGGGETIGCRIPEVMDYDPKVPKIPTAALSAEGRDVGCRGWLARDRSRCA